MQSKRQWMAVNRIKTRAPFKDLFPVNDTTVDAIAQHMQINGFDVSQPIVLWDRTEEENKRHALYVIDGHSRLYAAKSVRLSPVYVARMKFASEEDALGYAIHNQRDRRNLTDADILRCIEATDKRKKRGERTDLASSEAKSGKSAQDTAKLIGTSKTKVEKARTILDQAEEETKQAVLKGEKSIHAGYKETRKKWKPPTEAELQKQIEETKEREKVHFPHPQQEPKLFAEWATLIMSEGRVWAPKKYEEAVDEMLKWSVEEKGCSTDIEALEKLYRLFLDETVKFHGNNSHKKRKWKKYLPELHRWTS